MRKALVVGVNFYKKFSCLQGCVKDASSVGEVISRHFDGSVNFSTRELLSSSSDDSFTAEDFRHEVRELFHGDNDCALLFFSGHGYIDETGGYLAFPDSVSGLDGVSLTEVLNLANKSTVKNKIIIIDSCYSGAAGDNPHGHADISDGMTILTASTSNQVAFEEDGGGVFSRLLVDALYGAAANIVGDITPGSIYAHIDQSLGPWDQRPVFKTNVKRFFSVRESAPSIELQDLRKIADFFPEAGASYHLDPSYEPDSDNPDPDKCALFAVLQKMNRINLVSPEDADHMYYAAMNSKSCKLTVLGEHYRKLIVRGLI